MSNENMMVALIHWRIKPQKEYIDEFLNHWKTENSIGDVSGLIAEFLSDTLPISEFPFINWQLDPDSLGNFRTYVTVGLWKDAESFKEQVAAYFNDSGELLPFEKYRRRRVIFRPIEWRIGKTELPSGHSLGVE